MVGEGKGWVRGGVGNVAECNVVMGYAFFIIKMHFYLIIFTMCLWFSKPTTSLANTICFNLIINVLTDVP